jgi:hypothetical protein
MTSLVGAWTGEYSSIQSGRSGSITFSLKSATDTAYGDVVMTPKGGPREVVTPDRPATGPAANIPQVLTIRFVRVEGNRMSGTLDPYPDPNCGCQLNTTFTGLFDGAARIEGTFESRGSMDHPLTTGKWRVKRVRR